LRWLSGTVTAVAKTCFPMLHTKFRLDLKKKLRAFKLKDSYLKREVKL
jgi:hypothetical protein|tara:strand:+ start:3266 stop:3409 length:144 start_codon:yes stop_codon:yes gene_type:complete